MLEIDASKVWACRSVEDFFGRWVFGMLQDLSGNRIPVLASPKTVTFLFDIQLHVVYIQVSQSEFLHFNKEAVMEYRNLGSSVSKYSLLGLGGNNFGWWIDEQRSEAGHKRALELGVNYIDTADIYDKGRSEEYIGQTLKGRRTQVILATKFFGEMGADPNDRAVRVGT